MNLRIGDRDSSDVVSTVRSGAPAGRTRTAVSDIGGLGDGARGHSGVVIRLSPDAQKILARGDRDERDALPARRGAGDTDAGDSDVGDATGQRGGAGAPPLAIGRPQSPDRPDGTGRDETGARGDDQGTGQKDAGTAKDRARAAAAPRDLSSDDKRVVAELAARDTAVRAHEAAHQAAAAGLGGAASFSYETGPDGKRYAVGGEVPVSIRPGRTPQETISNAQTVRSAALAPADPSAQDMAVASEASQMEAEARQEIMSGADKAKGGDAGGDATGVRSARTERGDRAAPRDRDPDRSQTASSSEAKTPPRDVQHDQIMVFSALRAERKTVDGIHQHLASGGSCAICSRAAARYA